MTTKPVTPVSLDTHHTRNWGNRTPATILNPDASARTGQVED